MKTLFIDFDGTICHDRFWRSLPKVEYQKIQNILFNDDLTRVDDWMRGIHTTEDICSCITTKTGISYELLLATLIHDCRTMYIDPTILNYIRTLRSTFYLVLITGNMDCFSRFTVPALALNSYFDLTINSADEGQLKTDNSGETFMKYVQGDIKASILIEDSPKTCAVFTTLGGTAQQVTVDRSARSYLEELLTQTV